MKSRTIWGVIVRVVDKLTSDELVAKLALAVSEWYPADYVRELALYDKEVASAEAAAGDKAGRLRVALHARDAMYDTAASKLLGKIKHDGMADESDLLARLRMGSHCTLSAVRDVLHVLVAEHLALFSPSRQDAERCEEGPNLMGLNNPFEVVVSIR